MSKHRVYFKVKYSVEIDTDDIDNYPGSVVQGCLSDSEMAEAMVRFDAHEMDEPAETWASWEDVEIVTSMKLADES